MMGIEETVAKYISDNIIFTDRYPHPYDASFLNEGIIDSMNILELVMFVEEQFGVKVEDEEIIPDNFDSVSRIAAYVGSKTAVALKVPSLHASV